MSYSGLYYHKRNVPEIKGNVNSTIKAFLYLVPSVCTATGISDGVLHKLGLKPSYYGIIDVKAMDIYFHWRNNRIRFEFQ